MFAITFVRVRAAQTCCILAVTPSRRVWGTYAPPTPPHLVVNAPGHMAASQLWRHMVYFPCTLTVACLCMVCVDVDSQKGSWNSEWVASTRGSTTRTLSVEIDTVWVAAGSCFSSVFITRVLDLDSRFFGEMECHCRGAFTFCLFEVLGPFSSSLFRSGAIVRSTWKEDWSIWLGKELKYDFPTNIVNFSLEIDVRLQHERMYMYVL